MTRTLKQEVRDLTRRIDELTQQIDALSGTIDMLVRTLSTKLTSEMIAANELSALEGLETQKKLEAASRELRRIKTRAFLETGDAYYD